MDHASSNELMLAIQWVVERYEDPEDARLASWILNRIECVDAEGDGLAISGIASPRETDNPT
jgi:hypothetical protein